MTATTPKFRAATGKQLIKAVDQAIKTKTLNNSTVDCCIGGWGEDFPHLRFKVEIPNKAIAHFDIAMDDEYESSGKVQGNDGSTCRTCIVKYKEIINIEYTDSKGRSIKTVEGKSIKDSDLLNKHLKEIFNNMRIYDYEDEHGYHDETCCDFTRHKLK